MVLALYNVHIGGGTKRVTTTKSRLARSSSGFAWAGCWAGPLSDVFSRVKKTLLVLLLGLLLASPVEGQTNFKAGYRRVNPVPLSSDLPLAEKVKMHRDFLEKDTPANCPTPR